MASFESAITKAIEEKVVSGAACIAVDKNGKTIFSKSFGRISIEDEASPWNLDTISWIASCTKLLTAVCILQCVERGQLDLDAPISKYLPEFESPDILTGFDENDQPILHKATIPITTRQLLTHSSGLGYKDMNPLLTKYWTTTLKRPANQPNSTIQYGCLLPLTFEPGKGWDYGTGIDWAGKIVERLNDNIKLGEYMKKYIFDPLSMTSTTFNPLSDQKIMSRMAGQTIRTSNGNIVKDFTGAFPIVEPEDDFGGHGLYSSATEYIKVLKSLLMDDNKLLTSESNRELFAPQIPDSKYIMKVFSIPQVAQFVGPSIPPVTSGTKFNYSLGGCVVLNEIPDRSGPGMMFWSGLPNLFWFIDREIGICGIYASFLLPPGDLPTQKLMGEFHRAMYQEVRDGNGSRL